MIINHYQPLLPSGNLTYIAIENVPLEIVDLPIQNGGSFQSFL